MGVLLGDASRLGHALLDRELYRPKAWTTDPARCQQAGIPADRRFATTPQLAQHMRQRALAAGVPGRGVTGDRGYGKDRRLRRWWEAHPWAYGLAVSGQAYVWLGWQPRQVTTLRAALPEDSWTRVSAGAGAKGPRWYDWPWRPLAEPVDPPWRRWLLGRRRVSAPQEMTAYGVFAPQATALEAVVRVAGSRWTIESGFEAAQGEVGLDHDEVRSWTGWDSASHPRAVGLRAPDRPAGGRARRGGVKKKSTSSPTGEPPGRLQSRTWPGLPLSVQEMRRLLWRMVLAVPQTAHHVLAWSHWRRKHQASATYYHDQRRGGRPAVLAA